MVNVNRSAGLPWNLLNDQIDSLSQRDTGWLQFYTENAQESLDTVIMAFKIAEHPEVQLPVMVVTEGFVLSHTGEPVEIPEQALVDSFLPPYKTTQKLNLNNPRSFGGFMHPIRDYFKVKIEAQEAFKLGLVNKLYIYIYIIYAVANYDSVTTIVGGENIIKFIFYIRRGKVYLEF